MVKGRLLPLVLVLPLAGCGGGGARNAATDPGLPALGARAVALAIEGPGNAASHTGMVGTGDVPGTLNIAEGIDGMDVRVVLASNGAARPTQTLTLHLACPDAIDIGTAVVLDGVTSTAVYQEGAGVAWKATGGNATVTALQTGTLTLSLANVTLNPATSGAAPLALSGTLTGRVEAPGR